MDSCQLDPNLQRVIIGDFHYPLGAYPVIDAPAPPSSPSSSPTNSNTPASPDAEDLARPDVRPPLDPRAAKTAPTNQRKGPLTPIGGLGANAPHLPGNEPIRDIIVPFPAATGATTGHPNHADLSAASTMPDPKPGYTLLFEPADGGPGSGGGGGGGGGSGADDEEDIFGGGSGSESSSGGGGGGGGGDPDWEEWPDRYVFDAVISAHRVRALCRLLFSLLPGRVYPILDVLGQDGYREIDPYIAYDLVPIERFLDGVNKWADYLYEDGMVGFGALSEEPFFYVFIDEHKIVTIRVEPELKERVERLLASFDLEQIQEPAGADATTHEHRGVLLTPPDRVDLLAPEEIVMKLRDAWELVLNVDPDRNLDEEGNELGIVPWRVVLRCDGANDAVNFAEVFVEAENLRTAEELAFTAVDELSEGTAAPSPSGNAPGKPATGTPAFDWEDSTLLNCDRIRPTDLDRVLEALGVTLPKGVQATGEQNQVLFARWMLDAEP